MKVTGADEGQDQGKVGHGKRDQLEGKIQERYGYARDQSKKEIDDWFNRLT